MTSPLRHDNPTDAAAVAAGEGIASPGLLVPGDVLASNWAPGTFVTVTSLPRMFLGEWIFDYVTETGGHGTIHIRVDVPARTWARHLAVRPADLS